MDSNERGRFEEEVAKNPIFRATKLTRVFENVYEHNHIQAAWEGWQARAALEAPAAPKEESTPPDCNPATKESRRQAPPDQPKNGELRKPETPDGDPGKTYVSDMMPPVTRTKWIGNDGARIICDEQNPDTGEPCGNCKKEFGAVSVAAPSETGKTPFESTPGDYSDGYINGYVEALAAVETWVKENGGKGFGLHTENTLAELRRLRGEGGSK